MPKRIQRKRTKGWKMPEGAVYVGRPTRWGNPFPWKGGDLTLVMVLESYRTWLTSRMQAQPEFLTPLRGKDLACWCNEKSDCHADILLELANQESA